MDVHARPPIARSGTVSPFALSPFAPRKAAFFRGAKDDARRSARLLAAVVLLLPLGCQSSHRPPPPEQPLAARAAAPPFAIVQAAAVSDAPVHAQLAHVEPAHVEAPYAEPGGPRPVEEYIAIALVQNPQIQAKRNLLAAAAQRVPQARSLEDPTIDTMGFPFYPNVPQTASGRMTVDMTVSQAVPWFGTLGTRARQAQAEVGMAQAELVAAELEVVEQVKRTYYRLYFAQKSLTITEQSRKLAVRFSQLADAKLRANQVSQQDLLRAQLEVLNIDQELVRLRQELVSTQAELARLMQVPPDTALLALSELAPQQIPQDLKRLYDQAIAMRPELQAQLAAIERDRQAINLARLKYFPDFELSFNWGEMTRHKALSPIADGLDDLGVGLMANVPIYRGRLDAGVREAEAKTAASARQYDALRDRTLSEVKDLFVQARSQQELLELFGRDIVPKAEQTLQVSLTAYEAVRIDILQLIDNWQQLLRYQLAQQRLEAQLRQTLASLERVVGGMAVDR